MAIKLGTLVTFQNMAALGAGLMLVVASMLFSPLWALVGLAVLGFAFVVIKRPEIGLLGYLVITSTILDQHSLARLPIGVGRLSLTDIILLVLFCLILMRLLVKRDFKLIHTPLDIPLLSFVGIAIISTILAIFESSLTLNASLGEIRTVMSYLTFFIVTNLVREKAQLRTLLKGLFILGTIVALATIAQSILGNAVPILPGRVEALGSEDGRFLDVTRVIPPGQSVMVVAFIAVFTTLVLQRISLIDALKLFQCGLLGLAIVVTFFRASWCMIALTVLLLGFLASRQERQRLMLLVLGAILSVTVILMVVMEQPESRGTSLAGAAFARLGTLANVATYEDPSSSLRWRDFEYGHALPKILANPFVGIGLGARYRPLTRKDHENFDGRTFIHNGHVGALLKSGIFGYAGLLWFLLAVLIRGLSNWRRTPDPYMRGIVLAFALTFIGVLIVSNVEPYVMVGGWTPVLGIIAGINEIILRRFSPGPSGVINSRLI